MKLQSRLLAKLTEREYATHVREFRQYGYDPRNSAFHDLDMPNDHGCCVNYWWYVRQAIDRGEFDGLR